MVVHPKNRFPLSGLIAAARLMGIDMPKVGALSAVEAIHSKNLDDGLTKTSEDMARRRNREK